MYVPPAFRVVPEAARAFLEARGFGLLTAVDGLRPVSSPAPFVLEGDTLALHVARANPLHEIVARSPSVTLICMGPDAYVTPDWYVSPDQVPTWNYVAVEVAGVARPMDPSRLRDHVDRLSEAFEARLPKKPWTSDKMDPRRLSAMLAAIVGIEIAIESVSGAWKLGQHKKPEDRAGVAAGLAARGEPGDLGLLSMMGER